MSILKAIWNILFNVGPATGLPPIRNVPPMPAVKPPRNTVKVDLQDADNCPFREGEYLNCLYRWRQPIDVWVTDSQCYCEGAWKGRPIPEWCPLRAGGVLVVADDRKENNNGKQ